MDVLGRGVESAKWSEHPGSLAPKQPSLCGIILMEHARQKEGRENQFWGGELRWDGEAGGWLLGYPSEGLEKTCVEAKE